MKLYKLQKLQQKRQFVAGRLIVGIDPAKAKHEAQILDTDGLPVGSSFSFAASFTGFHEHLWRKLQSRLPATLTELPRQKLVDHLVFAVEASCNLWPTLVDYLEAQHYRVVMVSPLSTCHARPAKSGHFSAVGQTAVAPTRRTPSSSPTWLGRAPSSSASATPPSRRPCTASRSPTTSCARTCSAAGRDCVRRSRSSSPSSPGDSN